MGKLILQLGLALVVWSGFSITLPSANANSIYIHKYQDENGVWHFTDTLPDTEQEVASTEALTSAPRQKIVLQRESEGQSDVIYAESDYYGPAEVEIRFVGAQNVYFRDALIAANGKDPQVRRYILPKRGRMAMLRIGPYASARPWNYMFEYRYLPGDPRAVPAKGHRYRLPFASGGRFYVSQAFNGTFSHQSPHNRYAVDISMPVGSPIHAARAGRVMEAMSDYFWAGENLTYYGPRANLIRILHDDGTMALYAHIKRGSAVVKAGQRVAAGEMIARSGNTGYSTGPHLHFSVLVNRGMAVVSLPFEFHSPSGSGIVPAAGMLLGDEL